MSMRRAQLTVMQFNIILSDLHRDSDLMAAWLGHAIEDVAYHIWHSMIFDPRLYFVTNYTNVEGKLYFGHVNTVGPRIAAMYMLPFEPVDPMYNANRLYDYLSRLPEADCGDVKTGTVPRWTLKDPLEAAYPDLPIRHYHVVLPNEDVRSVDGHDDTVNKQVEVCDDGASQGSIETDNGHGSEFDNSAVDFDFEACSPITSTGASLVDVKYGEEVDESMIGLAH